MNAASSQVVSRTTLPNTLAWLVRRELWEHRSLYIAPLVAAGVLLLSVVLILLKLGHVQIGGVQTDAPMEKVPDAVGLFILPIFSLPFAAISAIVGIYYALDCLYADRRDRSVLFWKSLPISDWEAVLAKFITAAVVTPAIAMVVAVATSCVIAIISSIAIAVKGHSPMNLWSQIPVFQSLVLLAYLMVVNILWFVPLTAWCMLASSWARRAVFLWAVVPIAAILFLESQVFGTHTLADQLSSEGGIKLAVDMSSEMFQGQGAAPKTGISIADVMTPVRFLTSAGLWGGIFVASGLLAATVWIRRYRDAS